jgi:hypothetical protein
LTVNGRRLMAAEGGAGDGLGEAAAPATGARRRTSTPLAPAPNLANALQLIVCLPFIVGNRGSHKPT